MKWTPEKIKIAKDILVRSRDIGLALGDIRNANWGTGVSLEALRRAFRRAGEDSPHELLGRNSASFAVQLAESKGGKAQKSGYVATKIANALKMSKDKRDVINCQMITDDKSKVSAFPKSFTIDGARVEIKYGFSEDTKKTTRILVISDLHVPYHDVAAWDCVLQVIRETKPETVVIIGDFADMYSISSHPKSLDRKMNFATERDAVNAALDELRAAAGDDCRIIFCEGNHEDRITRFLQSSAPELGGIKEIRAEGLFKIKERNIEWQSYRSEPVKIGNCSFTHDVGRCGVNCARQSLMDFGGNLVVGHSHRGACVYQGEIKGSSHFCLNVGWLGDVNAIDYIHRVRAKRDWQLGFGLVDQDETGYSWAQFIPVLNGQCIVDGKVISGQSQKAAA